MEEKQPRILIVEDEIPQLNALADTFLSVRFAVLKARNGEEGLAAALNEKPDIILLDLLMPGMDGMSMLKKLRASGTWGRSVPVVLLTNLSPDDEQRLRDVTATEPAYYLIKSEWTLAQIVGKVRECLARPASPET